MADYRNTISRTLYHEGGLSKALTDTSAAKDPVPDGSGYHTNKGVTWATFKSLSSKVGYTATPALFYKMPMDIWLKIFVIGFWLPIDGSNIKSQAIADMLVQRAWGSGSVRAIKMIQEQLKELGYNVSVSGKKSPETTKAINLASNTKAKETNFVKRLFEKNMSYLKTLHNWETYKNGWTKRWNELYQNSLKLIKGGSPIKTAALLSLAALTIIYHKDIAKALKIK